MTQCNKKSDFEKFVSEICNADLRATDPEIAKEAAETTVAELNRAYAMFA